MLPRNRNRLRFTVILFEFKKSRNFRCEMEVSRTLLHVLHNVSTEMEKANDLC